MMHAFAGYLDGSRRERTPLSSCGAADCVIQWGHALITLNSDKGLVQVEDWADIMTRPGFIKDLDPTAHKLKAIIGRYAFSEKIRCGLSDCHTPHAKGYIVVTEDGHETNIGKDCGKTYFGVDFEEMSRRFDQDLDDLQNREILATFSFRLDDLESRIKSLREGEHGADWAYKNTRPLLSVGRGCPETAVRRVVEMVRARNPEVSVERRATEEEVEQLEVQVGRRMPRPHYLSESIGYLSGLEAFTPKTICANCLSSISKRRSMSSDNSRSPA